MEELLAHCSTVFSGNGNLFFVFFIGGLTGSLTHCLSMCGPIVACQAACGSNCGNKLSRSSQFHYHIGRAFTYGLLGFVAAGFGRHLSAYSFWPALSTTMLITAGILFLGSGIFGGKHRMFLQSSKNSFLRGLLMGFMPCGLLYAALLVASTITNPISGMIVMYFFVLGTTPLLMLTSSSASVLAQKWENVLGYMGRVGLTFNGLALLAMAAKIVR